MSNLRVAGFPAADEEMASSRLRYFEVCRELRLRGVHVETGPDPAADVLYVQKRLTPEILDAVRAARTAGKAIVYDVDDSGLALSLWAPAPLVAEMRTLADVITVSSEEQREEQLAAGAKTVEVVENMIDYGATKCVRASALDEPLRIAWFGNRVNARLFARHADVLRQLTAVQVIIITDPTRLPELFKGFEIRPWRRESFVADLQSCHLSCLMHDGWRPADRGKSNTRMVTSIAWGVPAIVSSTGAYDRTAKQIGVPDAVFSSADDLVRIVEHYRSAAARAAYLDRAQPAVWQHYAPVVIARRLHEVLDQALREAR